MPPKRHRPVTIVLAATKGGVGKTTIASALAVRAAADGARVALLDTDPQLSLARWHELRGFPDNPKILDVDASSEAMALVQAQRWDYLIVDTPPAMLDRIQAAVYLADLIVIPLRPSGLDVEACRDVIAICKDAEKPFVFLINQMQTSYTRLAVGARKYLEDEAPVLITQIGLRKAYVSAMTLGKSGPELKDRAASTEIDELWAELKELVRVHHG